ncbi:hypothetical protein B0H11DRAFT_472220 [Mycena galericulata]|nr:hypothetical protein B0H11DRAFT_472220 [Mycena galericulata]
MHKVQSEDRPRLLLTALLATPPGDADHIKENLWFIADFIFAHHLLVDETYDASWLTQIDISKTLETLKAESPTSPHVVLHGPHQSHRFELPIPSGRERFYTKSSDLKAAFLDSIENHAEMADSTTDIVILVFAHDDPKHLGQIQCGSNNGETIWVTKKEIEKSLKNNKAHRVSLVSTSLFSRNLESRHWTLFAAAQLGESLPLRFPPEEAPLHNLAVEDWAEALSRTCAAMHNSKPGSKEHQSFQSSVAANQRWQGFITMVGIQSSIESILKTDPPPQKVPNPLSASTPTTDSPAGGSAQSNTSAWDSDSDSGSDSPLAENRSSSCRRTLPTEDETEVDEEELTRMVTHWIHKARPLSLDTAARQSLLRHANNFLAGTAAPAQTRSALFRLFSARGNADALAQRLADELGISDPELKCVDFREVEYLPAWRGIEFYEVNWGELAPDSGRPLHRYVDAPVSEVDVFVLGEEWPWAGRGCFAGGVESGGGGYGEFGFPRVGVYRRSVVKNGYLHVTKSTQRKRLASDLSAE